MAQKIAFFFPSLGSGASRKNIINLLSSFDKKKYKMTLVTAEKNEAFLKGVPKHIDVLNFKSRSFVNVFFKLVKCFNKKEFDVFVSAFPRFNAISLLAKTTSNTKTKIILAEHKAFSLFHVTASNFGHRLIARFIFPYFIKIFYPKADAIVCVSQGVKEDLDKIMNSSVKTRVIYNAIVNKKLYKLSLQKITHQWFKDKKIPVILAVGRLIKAKDYPTLLKAFALVLKQKSAYLVILGEGKKEGQIKQTCLELGVFKNVAFLGFQENPYKYMGKASVFALSSLHEGFGNVLVEAMACGAPVVSTDCSAGPKEIIENHKNGILVPVGDPNLLAKALLEVLNNPALSHKLSEAGKARAKDFTVEKSAKAFESLFKELIFK